MRLICLRSIEALLLPLLLLLLLKLLQFAEATKRTMRRHRSACGLHEPGPLLLFQIWKLQIDRGFWIVAAMQGS
jgi:hypothetical protein